MKSKASDSYPGPEQLQFSFILIKRFDHLVLRYSATLPVISDVNPLTTRRKAKQNFSQKGRWFSDEAKGDY